MSAPIDGRLHRLLLDYLRQLEDEALQIRALPSLAEREAALADYQNLCQQVVGLILATGGLRKTPRRPTKERSPRTLRGAGASSDQMRTGRGSDRGAASSTPGAIQPPCRTS